MMEVDSQNYLKKTNIVNITFLRSPKFCFKSGNWYLSDGPDQNIESDLLYFRCA